MTVENRLIEGILYKKPFRNSLLWKKRYFVLVDNEVCLYYYETKEKSDQGMLRGKLPFSSVHLWDGKPNGFQFYTPLNKLYRVYCDTEEDRNAWVEKMQKLLDTAPEKQDGQRVLNTKPVAPATPVNARSIKEDFNDLKSEISNLRSELFGYKNIAKRDPSDLTMERRCSVLDDGTEIKIAPQDLETMRQIFNLFDAEGHGYISIDDLQSLHKKLGEPITKEEATEAIQYIDPIENKVNFVSFLRWWNEDHKISADKSEKMERYKAKFKFLKARIANPVIGLIETEPCGPFPSFEFRQRFYYQNAKQKVEISPWHDIPLYNSDGSVNFICEIPKWTRKKMEIATGEPYNPIKQDTKNGKLREYTWGDMMFNYGALAQTWEDPEHVTEGTGCKGDNDPIDVVEIGTKQWPIGAIVQVKVLGVLALIDSGETDWKLICINIEDHYAPMINDVADIDAHIPGCINAIRDWLRDYKLPKINEYGYDGKCMNREFAESVIAETHEFWKQLVDERGGMATV